ncbi:hypothetical protein J3R83DRAFT_10109 [Lanmaoa asiatica]|nr:hypothetical protein J3R83DRAFT_10109 [Lanmaoa asiatica]
MDPSQRRSVSVVDDQASIAHCDARHQSPSPPLVGLSPRPFLPLQALHASLPPHPLAVLVPDPSIPEPAVIPASSIMIQQPRPHHVSALSGDAYLPGHVARPTLPPTPQLYFTAAGDNTAQYARYYIPQTTVSPSGEPAQAWRATMPLPQSLEEHAVMMMTHGVDFTVSTSISIAERPLLKVGFRKGDHFQRVEPNPTQSCARSSSAFASQERPRSPGDDRTMARAGHPYLVAHAARATSARQHVSPDGDLFRSESCLSNHSAVSLPTTFSWNYANPSSSNLSDIPTACRLPADPTNPPEVGHITTTANNKDMNRQQALKEAEHLVIYEMLSRIGWPEIPAKKTTASVWKQTFREALNQACRRRCIEITFTDTVASQFTRRLTEVRAALAIEAKGPAMALIKSLVDSLMDESIKGDLVQLLDWKKSEVSKFTKGDTTFYFLHQLNKDVSIGGTFEVRLMSLQRKVVDGKWFTCDQLAAFHKAFWYGHRCSPLIHIEYILDTTPTIMYALSATALRFALRREVALETSFNTERHAPEFRKIFVTLHSQITQGTLIGKKIIAHLRMLHQEGQIIASGMKRLVATTEQTEFIYIPSAEELHLYESNSFAPHLDGPVNQPVPGPSNWPEQFQPQLNYNFLPPARDAQSQLEEELSAYGCFIHS